MSTLLGFDFGPRKIGVAVGQTVTGTARPLRTLRCRNQRPDWAGIEALVREWTPSALVLGLPLRTDDTPVDWADQIHRFARQLEGRFGLKVHLIDERLTSVEARDQISSRPGRKPADHLLEDAVAAALILETWLTEHATHAC